MIFPARYTTVPLIPLYARYVTQRYPWSHYLPCKLHNDILHPIMIGTLHNGTLDPIISPARYTTIPLIPLSFRYVTQRYPWSHYLPGSLHNGTLDPIICPVRYTTVHLIPLSARYVTQRYPWSHYLPGTLHNDILDPIISPARYTMVPLIPLFAQ